jgi:hypothetical protein
MITIIIFTLVHVAGPTFGALLEHLGAVGVCVATPGPGLDPQPHRRGLPLRVTESGGKDKRAILGGVYIPFTCWQADRHDGAWVELVPFPFVLLDITQDRHARPLVHDGIVDPEEGYVVVLPLGGPALGESACPPVTFVSVPFFLYFLWITNSTTLNPRSKA